jgi:hypothetical protein
MQVLNELERVRWDEFVQPAWNTRDEVPSALRALADTTNSDGSTAYHRLLYAVGNNHSGTYFPVVIPTIPFIGQILERAQLAARLRALDVLVDLVGSFSPDPAFGQVATSQGLRCLHRLPCGDRRLQSRSAELIPSRPKRRGSRKNCFLCFKITE